LVSLICFYLLHVAILPIVLLMLLAVHAWRIRKDGGLSRPDEDAPPSLPAEGEEPADWQPGPSKTYGLMAVVRGWRAPVGRPVEDTVPAWPNVLYFEAAAIMLVVVISLGAALLWNAPLKEMANPLVPENPAKAPWYFLGLQELVSYSAFAGGMLIPMIVLIGLALIPFLDQEPGYVGIWFSGPRGKRVALTSLLVAAVTVIGIEWFAIANGWLRDWFPDIPQLVITFVNPGTIITLVFALWSLRVMQRTNSTRMAAIALFTCFLVGFLILTVIGMHFRGPNWNFFWSHSQWPVE